MARARERAPKHLFLTCLLGAGFSLEVPPPLSLSPDPPDLLGSYSSLVWLSGCSDLVVRTGAVWCRAGLRRAGCARWVSPLHLFPRGPPGATRRDLWSAFLLLLIDYLF